MDDREPYWLVDTELGQRDPAPEDMSVRESQERNAFMERQHSRWRWLNGSELKRFEETLCQRSENHVQK